MAASAASHAEAALRLDGTGARLDGVTIRKSKGPVTGAAYIGWDSTYSLNAAGRRMPVERIALLHFPAAPLTGIANVSTGTSGDIDTAGAGQGDAICAECHFRLHSTAQAYDATDRSNPRLVNFAPDVVPANGTLSWTSTGIGQGSCTLTCHGYTHVGTTYAVGP